MGSESVKVVVRCRPLNDRKKVLSCKMVLSMDLQRCQCFIEKPGGTGKKTLLGIGGDVVVKLCETLPAEQNYKVFADNFFSSAPLVLTLLQRQIYFVGTLRGNRLAGCQLEDEKSLAQRGRGSVDARVNKEESMVIVKWYDNKSVTLISSYCATEPQDTVRRWSKSDKAFVEVKRPHIVKEYNTFMGGIDLLDACIARYKYHMKSRRWYLYLFWQTIMLGVVNAWLIYRRDCKLLGVQKPLKQRTFQAEVARSLILWKSHRGRPSQNISSPPPPPKRVRVGVPEDVRTDEVAHWPVKCEKRGRCKNCKCAENTKFLVRASYLEIYDEEIRDLLGSDTKQRLELKAAKLEIRDLQAEFEVERNDYLATIRRLEKEGQLLHSLLERMVPLVHRDCNYSNLDRLKKEAVWDEDSATWRLPDVMVQKTTLPSGHLSVSGSNMNLPVSSDAILRRPFRLESLDVPVSNGKVKRKKSKSRIHNEAI
ncbi:hypothetical protein ACER0C_019681 [Sarotherodon galilaeus]